MLTKNADMIQNKPSTMPKSWRATSSDDATATLHHDVSQLCENVSTYIADTLTAIPPDNVYVPTVVSGVSNVLPVPDAVPVTEFTTLGEGSSCFAPPPWPWSPTVPLDDKVMDFLRKRGDIAQKEVVQYEKFARLKRHEVKLIDHLLKEFGTVQPTEEFSLQLFPAVDGLLGQLDIPVEGISLQRAAKLFDQQVVVGVGIVACFNEVSDMLFGVPVAIELLEFWRMVAERHWDVLNPLRVRPPVYDGFAVA
ncbi:hypothetical protein H6P81_010297 [Aristolochia fimbriata]|uniref:Uncharacterized protein n=1 Tax=Aristolochia fimbriata TaxID=158543 RepID=A0AAV7ERQ0_ARIFI|nr:hypothetical protein H6P81_010297 [Aristolochia fimbriata]